MRERVSCFDIDGTLSRGPLLVQIIQSEYQAGLLLSPAFHKIQDILEAYKANEIDYETTAEQLLQVHARGLAGQLEADLQDNAANFLRHNETKLFHAFGRKAVHLLREHGRRVLLVTAEPDYLATAMTEFYDVDGYVSTQYDVVDERFVGSVGRSLAHRSAKHAAITDYDIDYAFGDSEGDIDMLAAADHAFCISPTDGLRDIALQKGWQQFDGDGDSAILSELSRSLR